ncbi:MAG: DUF11 domain-containing protein [Sphingomonadaceae bacterium]|nr:DUF11 domain-containing protein [Sphingomonadaceae bacterium]
MTKLLIALVALLAPVAAHAANDVALTSEVFVEKAVPDAAGRTRLVLEPPKVVVPGDRLVFVLGYKNLGRAPAADFVVTNPMPSAVAYQGAADGAAMVSVDGGRSWGALPALKVRGEGGVVRAARPEDVTHVRWAMKMPIPVGAAGKLSFRGVVR